MAVPSGFSELILKLESGLRVSSLGAQTTNCKLRSDILRILTLGGRELHA